MTVNCGSGDSFTDYDGRHAFAECNSVAVWRWGTDGDDYVLFCDQHLLKALMEEVADNKPEDMYAGPLALLNHCEIPTCTNEVVFKYVHVSNDGHFVHRVGFFCDACSLLMTPYRATVEFVDTLPQVLQEA
jgi:hypothetical protein